MRVEIGRLLGEGIEDEVEGLVDGGAAEGRSTRQALVQDRPQRIHIDARVDVLTAAPDLLGRHVVGRAHDGAGRGHR